MAGWEDDKMIYQFNWQHFTQQDFADLQERLRENAEEILPGGEYYGQVRIGDVCFDIQAEWLGKNERHIFVTLTPFFPHDKNSRQPPYQEMVPGMPFDACEEASLVIPRLKFLSWHYLQFCHFVTSRIEKELQADVFKAALRQDTGFWNRHDARLQAIRQLEARDRNDKM